MLRLEIHLARPRLLQVLPDRKIKRGENASARLTNGLRSNYLLHDLILLLEGLMLQGLHLNLMLNEFLIIGTLDLAAGIAHFGVVVHLVGQVHSQVLLLLFMGVEVDLDLVKCLLGAEIRLVVQRINRLRHLFDICLFSNLVPNEVLVGLVHLDSALCSKGLLPVEVVDGGVELILFCLTTLLHTLSVSIVARKSLLIDSTNRFKSLAALESRMIIDGKGTLRAHELRH